MRYKTILFGVMLIAAAAIAVAGDNGKGNEEQRRSIIGKRDNNGSFPRPFPLGPADNPNPNPAVKNTIAPVVSTGYYIVDSDDNADPAWKNYPFRLPIDEIDLNYQPTTWRQIVSGAHQFPESYWDGHPEGKPFFQNPATKTSQLPYGTDSTDNAFAGPIPIGFDFYFNGFGTTVFMSPPMALSHSATGGTSTMTTGSVPSGKLHQECSPITIHKQKIPAHRKAPVVRQTQHPTIMAIGVLP